MVDRQFCDLVQPQQLTAPPTDHLIRFHAKVSYQRDASRNVRRWKDQHGQSFIGERRWMGEEQDLGGDLCVGSRRIDVPRPVRSFQSQHSQLQKCVHTAGAGSFPEL